ncbi:MAG: hypothetical protein IJH84_24915 [Saccharopolyspora sp.]|uniref:hypothetical protein n=1 Tax=Saccharopolyspora sp. TaxID=33915 RepID=UPI0025E5DC66|nr:hypothetical protein [Saccharopolyspora sp.]MBQ6644251.1 hypothetical protein [Saccharopolyspora sp.]
MTAHARNVAASWVLALTAPLAACGATPPAPPAEPPPAPALRPPPPEPELPGGGRTVLPEHRMVGFSGAPGSAALGPLHGDLDAAGQQIDRQAQDYTQNKRPLPVFELIATRATSSPGQDGQYRARSSDSTIDEHLAAARRYGAVLLLGIQPGRADFLDEVRHYDRWLAEPDVGLALDPEWAVGPDETPGDVFGTTTGGELNAVADHVSAIAREHSLPQKPLIYHQLSPSVVRDEQDLAPHPELALVKSMDGIGSPELKKQAWDKLVTTKPPHVATGIKLFFQEDTRSGPLMTPPEVLGLQPAPDYVLYE